MKLVKGMMLVEAKFISTFLYAISEYCNSHFITWIHMLCYMPCFVQVFHNPIAHLSINSHTFMLSNKILNYFKTFEQCWKVNVVYKYFQIFPDITSSPFCFSVFEKKKILNVKYMNNFYCGLTKKRRDHYIDQFESTPPQNAFTQGSSFLTN